MFDYAIAHIGSPGAKLMESDHPVLNSWKEIAGYLGCGVRTAQRWEESGLPVRRAPGGRKSSVMAFRSEVDVWIARGRLKTEADVTTRTLLRSDLIVSSERLRAQMSESRLEFHNSLKRLWNTVQGFTK
jgi:phage terminase Nu1 subunit (DNA packaging protein)